MSEQQCERCKNPFFSNPLIKGDNVCRTCSRLNDITFWYPVLFHSQIPVPKTIILHTNIDMEVVSYGKKPDGFDDFVKEVRSAIKKVGLPAFFRTGYLSNKHDWKNSCFITDLDKIQNHITSLVEMSDIATIDRFCPCDFFAVREIIKTKPYFTYFSGDMPITSERRYFVRNGKIECQHPYWPAEVFPDIDKKQIEELNRFGEEDKAILDSMATYISKKFSGYWSVDFLKDINNKWYCTDMAIGESSYHETHLPKND